MIEILRAGDEPLDFIGTEHNRQPESLLRIRQVLTHVAPVQDVPTEEPQRADLGDDCPRGQPPLLEEEEVIAPEVSGRDAIEARARVLAECADDLNVTADG